MNPPLPRLPHWLLASAVALGALAATPALAEPTAPPFGTIKGESQNNDHKDMAAAQATTCAAVAAGPLNVASDPEEGGQVTARTAKPQPKPKPNISEINVMKTSDKASASLAAATPTPSCR